MKTDHEAEDGREGIFFPPSLMITLLCQGLGYNFGLCGEGSELLYRLVSYLSSAGGLVPDKLKRHITTINRDKTLDLQVEFISKRYYRFLYYVTRTALNAS